MCYVFSTDVQEMQEVKYDQVGKEVVGLWAVCILCKGWVSDSERFLFCVYTTEM